MSSTKSSFVEKVLGRIDVLDPLDLQSFVERLARERSFLETLFNTIEDGVLVANSEGKIIYLNNNKNFLIDLIINIIISDKNIIKIRKSPQKRALSE